MLFYVFCLPKPTYVNTFFYKVVLVLNKTFIKKYEAFNVLYLRTCSLRWTDMVKIAQNIKKCNQATVLNCQCILSPKSNMDVSAGPPKSDFLHINFLAKLLTHQYTRRKKEKHRILTKLGDFYNNLPTIHPIYVIWAPSSLMKPPNRYTRFREKAPQTAGTLYVYHVNVRTPRP